MFKNIRGFTLVELIVVVTIIAILWTVGFVSYSNYLTWARDSNRISQMTRIADALQVYGTTRNLPLPDNALNIQVGGWNIVWYQGDLWESVLQSIDYSTTARDPSDNSPFVYYLGTDRRNFQLMAFMEEQTALTSFVSQAQANEYINRFPKTYGRRMGILLQNDSNIPLQNIFSGNIELQTHTFATAYLTDTEQIVGTASWELLASSPIASCKRRRETSGATANGVYNINPAGTEIQVYCEMNEQGGGWTLAARSVSGGSWAFTWDTARWNINNIDEVYILWWVNTIDYSQVMLAAYQNGRNIVNYKTIDSSAWALNLNTPHTLSVSWITGWTSWDAYNWEQWMIFVR